MRQASTIRLLLAVGVGLAAATAVWAAAERERSAARQGFGESRAAEGMLVSMLEQESSFRAYLELRRLGFLRPYRRERRLFEAALARARLGLGPAEVAERRSLDVQERLARAWQARADAAIADARAGKRSARLSVPAAVARGRLIERFRAANGDLREAIDDERDSRLAKTAHALALAILVVSLLVGVSGFVALERRSRATARRRAEETSFRERQTELSETLQVMSDEPEAHELVKRHLERAIPGSRATVLNRNNSENRLVVATSLPEQSELAERTSKAEASACLAVRLGRRYERACGADPLLSCELCDLAGRDSLCVPSLVGGEVVGSVLVDRDGPLDERERQLTLESVSLAAPVLANLRNLAIAETRAATDPLTGLPNKRAVQETLKRMLAQAARTGAPLSAIMLDLDHFKQINDVYGHDRGDEVLAAVGDAVGQALRAADFVGRYGGEEFLVLLPDTEPEGAVELAEKLRRTIRALDLARIERSVSASFGVATYPTDAPDAEELVRAADRALYLAKDRGRDRVEAVAPPSVVDSSRVASSPDADAQNIRS